MKERAPEETERDIRYPHVMNDQRLTALWASHALTGQSCPLLPSSDWSRLPSASLHQPLQTRESEEDGNAPSK